MDVVSVGFLVLVVAIGAVIALIADNLGRTLGKKRLKFLHLRPRHTAMLFTALAGLAIPLVTVIIVASVSSDVRQWILEGRKAIADVKQLRQDLDELTKERADKQKSIDELERQRSKAQIDLKTAAQANQALTTQSKRLSAQMEETKAGLARVRRNLSDTVAQLKVTSNTLKQTKVDLKAASDDLERAKVQVSVTARQYNELTQQYQKLDVELQRSERLVKELEQNKAMLEGEIATAREAFKKEVEENEKELGTLRADLARTQGLVAQAQSDLDEAQRRFTAIATSGRINPLIYSIGSEVARVVVPANQANSGARNQLTRLLRVARVNAESHGASGREAAGLFGYDNPETEASRLVSIIAGVPEERLLVATAMVNAFKGEPVPVTITSFPYRKAFEKGEVVAEVRIDGDLKPSEVLKKLTEFLSGPVKQAAIARNMIPIAGSEASFGTVETGQVLDLVYEIVSQSRTARVQAITETDVFTGDELKLTFRIR